MSTGASRREAHRRASLAGDLIAAGVVAAVYVTTAKLGLSLSVAYGNATPVWPPTGIALAALLLFGRRLWPGVFLGAFIANATTPIPVAVAAGIAVGNTLEAIVGATVLQRLGFRTALDRVRDVLVLATLAAIASTAVSATVGVTSLWLAGEIPSASYGYAWGIWWFGDAIGNLLVAPLLMVWLGGERRRLAARGWVEVIALLATAGVASWAIFLRGNLAYGVAVLPFMIWAALRFGQRGATAITGVVSVFAIWGSLGPDSAFLGASATQSVTIMQTLMAIVSVTALIFAAVMGERARTEESVRRNEAQLAEAQQIAHVGSWEWEIDANVVTWSDELHRIYGIEPVAFDATYDGFLARVHPEDRAMVSRAVERSLQERAPFSIDHRIVRPDDTERILNARGEVILDAGGRPVRMVGTGQDVTERKMLEAFKDEFIAQAAHELRTPIAAIVGFTAMLSEGPGALSPDQVRTAIDRVEAQSRRLEKLIESLLDLTRWQRGRLAVELRPVDLSAVASSALDMVPVPEGTRVDVDLDGKRVLADPVRLDQILVNLLQNAFRYGGTHVRIEASPAGDAILLSVSDDGEGVPAPLVPRLFDSFARGDNATGHGGSGLGLAIVRMLAEALGGTVAYEPREPRGSRFVVRLRAVV